jgi:pimeloyl-ACP methyl ester carboxylesterase
VPYITTSDGTRLHYLDRGGDGAVLMLVHGYTGSSADWEELLPLLPADWRIVRPDLRGAGESDKPERGYLIETYARDLADLAAALSLPPFVLIGHSMGGAIAVRFAIDHQDLLRGLILLAPAPLDGLPPPDPALIAQMEQMHGNVELMKQMAQLAYARPLGDATVERGITQSLKVSEGHRRESLDSMAGLRLADRLAELKLPVLMVGGDLDNLVPVATMLESYARIPDCGLQIFHRVGHMVQQEVPVEFASLVQDFVANRARPVGATAGSGAAASA